MSRMEVERNLVMLDDMVYGDGDGFGAGSGVASTTAASTVASTTSNVAANPAASAAGGDNAQPKRTRVLLSCAPCRVSKLKCDRESPCGNCLKKDRIDLCEYAPRPKKPAKPAKGMASRLRRLEGMLREMMDDDTAAAAMSSFGVSSADLLANGVKNGATDGQPSFVSTLTDAEAEGYDGMGRPIPPTATTAAGDNAGGSQNPHAHPNSHPHPTPQARGKGRVVRGKRGTTYVGATHFMAMLDDIEDLKAYFDDPQNVPEDEWQDVSPAAGDSPEHLMLGGQQPRTRAELLAVMPPRLVVDRLIARYFGSNTPTQHTLHRPSFSRKYKEFWQDPANADVDFLAVLFNILALGVHFSTYSAPHELDMDGTGMTPTERYRVYRGAASAALGMTRFSSPNLHTVRAMLMFAESEFLVNRATQTNCFLLLAVCIRLMLKMGLHRDPSRLPNISAFEGEMRRRLWNLAIQIDLIVSFYLGLPSMIHGIPSDTSLAHNLLDEDFNEDSPVLPPPRPDSEYTVMSYPIFKSMLCRIFGQVARLAHTLTPPKYAEVLRTDRLLEDKWRQIPAFMKVRPLGDCVADPPMQVIQRFGIASLYQKSRCVLHRPYLVEAVPLPEHAYSRRTCLQSALTLLAYHEAIHEATQPGGLLHHIGWFITGLGMHDFLLAAMIVYLVVQNDNLFESELLTSRDGGGGSTSCPTSNTEAAATATPSGPATNSSGGSSGGAMASASVSSSGGGAPGSTGTAAPAGATAAATTATATADYDVPPALPVDRNALIELLRRSHRIWTDAAERNSDTLKAADLLNVMLRKIYAREMRENGSPPDWAPPPDNRRETQPDHHQQQQQQQQNARSASAQWSYPSSQPGHSSHSYNTPQSTGMGSLHGQVDPVFVGGVPALSQATLQTLGIKDTVMPAAHPLGQPPPPASLDMSASDAQMGFSRRDLVPPSQLPAGATNNMGAPSRYDSWIPLSLDALDWGTVDSGIRVVNSQETEWTGENSVINDINYVAAGMWDQPDPSLQ
ncbi:hypothetical protein SPBR_05567 [Sporothrix brasiliensis 5110]|uniref:Zn(2)-C6 fungal-type domain-containing protein n=1 Tax=Sporothrix brasiliensis 5110 TaxID=1398154 RepID=A0A0C2F6D1_9PEZI|nr:uncharacterized protein SPBR_05567 [Sporothrix brasiliensis 5110]KIH94499.1 hypothetical protein SPBR_05567 [Sporothrix brasiliensis 5110]